MTTTATPDWYADPAGRHRLRYWDGQQWTAQVSDRGDVAVDELLPPPPLPQEGQVAVAVQPPLPKSPTLCLIASGMLPGLGTFVCGRRSRGLLILGLSAVCMFGVNPLAAAMLPGEPAAIGTLLAIPVWVWGMIDAYRSAGQWNAAHGVATPRAVKEPDATAPIARAVTVPSVPPRERTPAEGSSRPWIKWLVLASISFLLFLMATFPSTADEYIRDGTEVWVEPGFRESLLLPTGVEGGVRNYWAGTLTLTLQVPNGGDDIVATTSSERDWDDTISLSSTDSTGPTLEVYFDVAIPSGVPAGTDLPGTVTGTVTTPQYRDGGFMNGESDVDEATTFHVISNDELDSMWAEQHRVIPTWMPAWILALPLVGFILVAVGKRFARRAQP